MKRSLALILAFAITVCLIGCVIPDTYAADSISGESERIECVYSEDWEYVYVDTETNVMYLFVKTGYGGGLTIMVDETGAPLLWED